jgi:hypothetical protein
VAAAEGFRAVGAESKNEERSVGCSKARREGFFVADIDVARSTTLHLRTEWERPELHANAGDSPNAARVPNPREPLLPLRSRGLRLLLVCRRNFAVREDEERTQFGERYRNGLSKPSAAR